MNEHEKNKNLSTPKLAIICLLVIVLPIGGVIIGLTLYFQNRFIPNTWMNHQYVTGRTVEEVTLDLFKYQTVPEELTVKAYSNSGYDCSMAVWRLSLEDLDCVLNYEETVRACADEQRASGWMYGLIHESSYEILPSYTCNLEGLRERWEELVSVLNPEQDYRIQYSEENGYVLYDGLSNRINSDRAFAAICEALKNGKSVIDLSDPSYYEDIPLSKKQEKEQELFSRLYAYENHGPVCDWGEGAEKMSAAEMVSFLEKDSKNPQMPVVSSSGKFQIQEEKVVDFVEAIAARQDTYLKEWQFESTRGDIVTVPGGTYGTILEQETEVKWLLQYLKNTVESCASGNSPYHADGTEGNPHIPAYKQSAFSRSAKTLGDTYVEVDMGIQKLYYYQGGKLRLETDVVTGNMRRKFNTPEGVNFVYAKETKRVLIGQGYRTPVDYWMPVNGAIGLHDASWRKEFGGDIYKKDGSHGCVNMPLDKTAELYQMIEIGTPVVMFYGAEPEV